jgi:hypothetical protein
MGDLLDVKLRCQFGLQKRKQRLDGTFTKGHPSSCPNPASGVWKVTFRQGRGFAVKAMLLCSDCGMRRMAERVRCIETEKETIFFRDVVSVELIKSFTSNYNPMKDWCPTEGAKHWVERPTTISQRQRPIKNSVPSHYIETLRRHDDGK